MCVYDMQTDTLSMRWPDLQLALDWRPHPRPRPRPRPRTRHPGPRPAAAAIGPLRSDPPRSSPHMHT